MSTVILLLAVALTLHVMPPIVPAWPAWLLTVQYLWAPVVLSGIAVVLAIAADSLRHAERREVERARESSAQSESPIAEWLRR